jgi:hypothetical protein
MGTPRAWITLNDSPQLCYRLQRSNHLLSA